MKRDNKTVHGWRDAETGKFRMGRLYKEGPSNVYETQIEAVAEADRRGLTLVWHDDA